MSGMSGGTHGFPEGLTEQPYKINERRDAQGIKRWRALVRCTKSVGSKEARLKWRSRREEQRECLHRKAETILVRTESGQYEEKQGSGGAVCFMWDRESCLYDAFSSWWFICLIFPLIFV